MSRTESWQLVVGNDVNLKIFNLLGQEVRTLVDERQAAGYHSVVWDDRDNSNHPVASGIYLYQLQAGKFIETRKLVLVK